MSSPKGLSPVTAVSGSVVKPISGVKDATGNLEKDLLIQKGDAARIYSRLFETKIRKELVEIQDKLPGRLQVEQRGILFLSARLKQNKDLDTESKLNAKQEAIYELELEKLVLPLVL